MLEFLCYQLCVEQTSLTDFDCFLELVLVDVMVGEPDLILRGLVPDVVLAVVAQNSLRVFEHV